MNRESSRITVIVTPDGRDRSIVASFGDAAAHEAMRGMALFAMKRFGAVGGFSARRYVDELVSVLPFADQAEAESLLKGFVLDLQARGIPEISADALGPKAAGGSVEVAVLAGIAQGQADEEIDSVIDAARNQQMEIARLRCDGGGNR